MKSITLKGGRVHNLKDANVELPKNRIIAVTGVSGSGKSSLAFDLLYEEARTRYLTALGLDSFAEKEKPFDLLDGLPPALAARQRTGLYANPRSTVGTSSGLYNLLRQLFVLESGPGLKFRHFSFNEPAGWCPDCRGMGYRAEFHESKIVPDPSLNLVQICESGSAAFGSLKNLTGGLLEAFGVDAATPYRDLSAEVKQAFLYGTDKELAIQWDSKMFTGVLTRRFEGAIPMMRKVLRKATSAYRIRKIESNYMTPVRCPSCGGKRLKAESLNAKVAGLSIAEYAERPLAELVPVLREAEKRCGTGEGRAVAAEIARRAANSGLAGIGYISLIGLFRRSQAENCSVCFLWAISTPDLKGCFLCWTNRPPGCMSGKKKTLYACCAKYARREIPWS